MSKRSLLRVFSLFLCGYIFLMYGGIRSPDSEVVFRVAESLESRHRFDVSELELWPGFGIAQGNDGNQYSIFGPFESIVAVPLVRLALAINRTEWYKSITFSIPVSHYYKNGLYRFMRGEKLTDADIEGHSLRFIVSFLNPIVAAIGVCIFWKVVLRVSGDENVAWLMSLLYGFGSLLWPYSGTFFSEPLAVTLALSSFSLLLHVDPKLQIGCDSPKRESASFILSGFFLGLSVATHISSILFAPFFYAYAICISKSLTSADHKNNKCVIINRLPLLFVLSFVMIILCLGYYNYLRFGNFLETGRYVSLQAANQFGYGHWTNPVHNIFNLMFSPGKGLMLYCPVVLLGLISFPLFYRKHFVLSLVLFGAFLVRWFFIASRTDWHGGFSVGPRYLLMSIPFVMLPASVLVRDVLQNKCNKLLALIFVFGATCAVQQVYFCVGDVFSFYHHIFMSAVDKSALVGDKLYVDWAFSPLLGLLNGWLAPFFLRAYAANNNFLWLFSSLGVVLVYMLFYVRIRKDWA